MRSFLVSIFFILSVFSHPILSLNNAIYQYVTKPDPSYSWEITQRQVYDEYTIYSIFMTSQSWRNEQEVSKTKWTHNLRIIIPKEIKTQTALLYINGGADQEDIRPLSSGLIQTAIDAKAIVIDLDMVPNQRLKFSDEYDSRYKEIGRKEDAIIAYTWKKFFETQDSEWPLRLPMTKSVVRAMDCSQEFCNFIGIKKPSGFVVSGMSKRGWTAWTTAAVDSRVVGLIPIVIDLCNVKESFVHHYNSYGQFSPALNDYLDIDILSYRQDPSLDKLLSIIDPFQFKETYTMPKYIINSTGDQFFLPDSSLFYFDSLPGQKYLRYVPNADHSLSGTNFHDSLRLFFTHIAYGNSLPQIYWKNLNNSLRVSSSMKPARAVLWVATNAQARDFRLTTIGAGWKEFPLKVYEKDGEFISWAQIEKPSQGWTAYFIELTYEQEGKNSLIFTTNVYINPDALPFNLDS